MEISKPFLISKKDLYRIAALVVLLGIVFASQNVMRKPVKEVRIAVNAETLKHLVFGFKLPMADLMWIRLVQDIDYRDPGDHPSLGWGFRLMDAITDLDSRFRIVYVAGATILSVGVGDVEGARRLFEKGALYYPHDWSLLYRAGYHYLYEVKNCGRAAWFFNQSVQNGAPPWVASLAARLYRKAGQYDLAKAVVLDALEHFKDTAVKTRLEDRLKEIELAEKHQLAGIKDEKVVNACVQDQEKTLRPSSTPEASISR